MSGLLRKKQKYSTLGPDGETKQPDSRRRKQKPEESPAVPINSPQNFEKISFSTIFQLVP